MSRAHSQDPRPRDPPAIEGVRRIWGMPPWAKRSHVFDKKGSLCGRYDAHEIPRELTLRPLNYDKICEGCLLAVAKIAPEVLMRAKYGPQEMIQEIVDHQRERSAPRGADQ